MQIHNDDRPSQATKCHLTPEQIRRRTGYNPTPLSARSRHQKQDSPSHNKSPSSSTTIGPKPVLVRTNARRKVTFQEEPTTTAVGVHRPNRKKKNTRPTVLPEPSLRVPERPLPTVITVEQNTRHAHQVSTLSLGNSFVEYDHYTPDYGELEALGQWDEEEEKDHDYDNEVFDPVDEENDPVVALTTTTLPLNNNKKHKIRRKRLQKAGAVVGGVVGLAAGGPLGAVLAAGGGYALAKAANQRQKRRQQQQQAQEEEDGPALFSAGDDDDKDAFGVSRPALRRFESVWGSDEDEQEEGDEDGDSFSGKASM